MVKIQELKRKARNHYNKIGKVYCPVIKEDVHFNAQGFHHLRYEVVGRKRTVREQAYKLYLLDHVETIVKTAIVVDEVRLQKAPANRKKKDGEYIIKDIIYTAIIGFTTTNPKKKVKVILRKVGNGQTIFWSVMKLKK